MRNEACFHLNKHAAVFFVRTGRYPENRSVYGHQLETGDVLEPTDVYDSSNGSWELSTCPGLVIQEGNSTVCVWVRPAQP